jgi:branched-chain amino acid transport system permease protein
MNKEKLYPVFALIVFIVFFQVTATGVGREYYLTQITMAAYYSLVVIGLTVLMGYTGQISIGHAAFFAIGGYTTAVLTTINLSKINNNKLVSFLINNNLTTKITGSYGGEITYLSPWIAFILLILITIVVAFLIGIPILKLKGHYLAMATLGFGTIVYRILLGAEIFGEADGISEVPPFKIFSGLSINGNSIDRVENYYIAWIIVITGMLLLLNLIHSRVGRGLRAIHGSEEAAESMGINTSKYKLVIFIISAVYAAIAGAFLTHYNGSIGPSEAGVMKSVRYVAIVAVGGMANLWGALIIGLILNYLSLRGFFGSYDDAIFGIILIVIIIFYPDGIFKKKYLEIIKIYFKKIFKKDNETTTG